MLERVGASLRIGLSRSGVALLHARGVRRRTETVTECALGDELGTAIERAAFALRRALTDANIVGVKTSVTLADDWVRLFIVAPPQNTTRRADCNAAAAMRFQALYGESPADWQIDAEWDARQPFLACAMPRSLLTMLQQLAVEYRLPLIAIAPHFVAAWNRWHAKLKASAWFGVAHEHGLTLGVTHSQRLVAVRAAAVPDCGWQDKEWLSEHVRREALRLDVPMPTQLQLCGALPGQWATQTIGALQCLRVDATQSPVTVAPASAALQLVRAGAMR